MAARSVTPARIGLARAGASVATRPLLEFRLAHARARDAVHTALDGPSLAADLRALGCGDPTLIRSQAARAREQYLLRPDLGRAVDPQDAAALGGKGPFDLALVIADGLSARAVQAHAAPVLAALVPGLRSQGWSVSPPVIAYAGRVAIGDEVAALMRAGAVLVLIGERPGLSAPDSLGAYLTWAPGRGSTDADRNCVSNIRPDGLPPAQAAERIGFLLREMRRLRLSGVLLKDGSEGPARVVGQQ